MEDNLSAPAARKAPHRLRAVATSSGAIAPHLDGTLPDPLDALLGLYRSCLGLDDARHIAAMRTAKAVLVTSGRRP